jgi:type IX secretion system PorP/SprF family membrane protein
MTRFMLIVAVLMVTSVSALQAQQLTLFTQYRDNASILNPASVESDFFAFEQNISFGASYRAQWVGLQNGPRTQTLRGSYMHTNGNSAVTFMGGGFIMNDQTGPTGFTGLYGRVAGIISPDPYEGGFVIGLSAGAVNFRIDASEIRLREEGDILGSSDQSQIFPDVGVGLYYYKAVGRQDDYFYTGISVPQVFGLDLTFKDEADEYVTTRIQHYYGMVGYIKKFRDHYNNDFNSAHFLEPSIWLKYTENAPTNVDFNLRYYMPINVWIGAGASTGGNFHAETGVNLSRDYDRVFRVGYGYDYSFSTFGPTAGATHEINLVLSLSND